MSKQVLDVHQMQHLQELGLELKPSLVHYYKVIREDNGKWYLSLTIGDILDGSPRYRYIPAYTLQDVLDALPDFIDEYCLIIDMSFGVIRYDNLKRKDSPILKETYFNNEDKYLIDAAYEILCWCVENGHVKTNKSK